MQEEPVQIAIGSLGTIGLRVAEGIIANPSNGRLIAVSALDQERATSRLRDLGCDTHIVGLRDLADADIVIECAPAAIFRDIAVPAIERGRTLVVATVGGLLAHADLIPLAQETGARIIAPTGAIAGLDAVRAMAMGQIGSATLRTEKSPASLAGAPFFIGKDFSPDAITEPTCVFRGNTLEAAKAFPANVNVAAALALAGAGPEATLVEIWADPAAEVNTHTISVASDAAQLDVTIKVLPNPDNPKSSTLTPLSILAALDSLKSPVRVGS